MGTSPLLVATPPAEGAVAPGAQVGVDDRGAQVVGLGCHDGAARALGHGVDEPARPGSSPSRKNVDIALARAEHVTLWL